MQQSETVACLRWPYGQIIPTSIYQLTFRRQIPLTLPGILHTESLTMVTIAAKSSMKRRQLVQALVAGAAGLPLLARAAWPDKPIRLVVHAVAGSAADLICRVLATDLARTLGVGVVIDNKPGAGGAIGIQEIARAAPDGYTIGYGNVGTLAINQALYDKLPYDADKQLASVALLGSVQNALVVNNNLPAKNVKELIALAKRSPGKLTTLHLSGELFKSMTGTFITHVPYRGSPQATQDLIGGQVDLMFDNLSSILPHIRSGRVRVLGVSGAQRSQSLPEVPTIAEAGVPGYETTAWGGIVAPAGTPREIILRLNSEINKVLALPAVIERYNQMAFDTTIAPADALFERALRERPVWARVVQRSGAKVD
jgi:tripartite-type tricarboxylate transporter receptor subunit TctC